MYNVTLSNRLNAIVNVTPKCRVIADIGCDHGKVLYKLLTTKKCEFGIGSDISEPCVEKTRQLLNSAGFKNFSIRVGDGFSDITKDDEVDTVVIAGMGGMEIIHILESGSIKFGTYILQPMSDIDDLRKYLNKNGYFIEYDKMMCERNKYYDIMRVSLGKQRLKPMELIFGKDNFSNLVFRDYLDNEIRKNETYLLGMPKDKRKEVSKKLKLYKKAYKIGESKWKNC